MSETTNIESGIGFYTVEQGDSGGWTGGLLMLNEGGRPLEFQCTLPVCPSRTHEILYGATLRPHLIGNKIGLALLKRVREQPRLIVTDLIDGLLLAKPARIPMGMLISEVAQDESQRRELSARKTHCVEVDQYRILPAAGCEDAVVAALESLPQSFDLLEPFERIREAIREAQQSLRAA